MPHLSLQLENTFILILIAFFLDICSFKTKDMFNKVSEIKFH